MKRCKSMLDKDDTINKLGDDLLLHIIDLLPLKDALRTSVLSSRWRYLPRSISNIDLDDFHFPSKNDGLDSLLDFIDKILVHHDTCNIKSFVSCKHYEIDDARINRWISQVMNHNVQQLRLSFSCRLWLKKPCVNLYLPLCLFKSESLTLCEIDMVRSSGGPIILGSESSLFSVHLPSLKRLKLSNVVFLNHHSAEQFFSNLPKLQQLCLDGCDWDNVKRLSINIPTLEEVEVRVEGIIKRNLDCQVTIVAPRLTYFKCKTSLDIDVLLSHTTSPLNVILVVTDYDEIGDRLAFIRVLESIKNSLSLHVNWNVFKWLEVYGIGSKDLPVFDNLKHLEISDSSYGEVTLSQMLMFLHVTPSLESLTIGLPDKNNDDWKSTGWYYDDEYDINLPTEKEIPSSCVTSQIQKFSLFSKSDIYASIVFDTAISLISYLMDYSQTLNTLEINWLYWNPKSYPTQRFIDQIQAHPRFSQLNNFSCTRTLIPIPLDYYPWTVLEDDDNYNNNDDDDDDDDLHFDE